MAFLSRGVGRIGNNGRQQLHTVRPLVVVKHIGIGAKLSGCIVWEVEGGQTNRKPVTFSTGGSFFFPCKYFHLS